MTCKEKYTQDHPELLKNQIESIVQVYCPHEMGIGYPPEGVCINSGCTECWNTELPEEKETNQVKKEKVKEKEIEKTMAVTDKKTKTELIEELDQFKERTAAVEKQLKNMERYKQYEECADDINAVHTAFVNAGFTDTQAFDLIKSVTLGILNSGMVKAVVRR